MNSNGRLWGNPSQIFFITFADSITTITITIISRSLSLTFSQEEGETEKNMVVSKKNYEDLRKQRLEENKKRMEELHLPQLTQALKTAHSPTPSPVSSYSLSLSFCYFCLRTSLHQHTLSHFQSQNPRPIETRVWFEFSQAIMKYVYVIGLA